MKDTSQSSPCESQNEVNKMWVSSDGGECIRSYDSQLTPVKTVRKENSYSTGDRVREEKRHHRDKSRDSKHRSHSSRDNRNHKHNDVHKKSSENKERSKVSSFKDKLENAHTLKSSDVKTCSSETSSVGGAENGDKTSNAKALKERSLSTEKQRDSKPESAKAVGTDKTMPDSPIKVSKSIPKDKTDVQPVPAAFQSNLMQLYNSVRALKEAGRPVANLVNGVREEKEVVNSRSSSQHRRSESSGRSDKHHGKSESSLSYKRHDKVSALSAILCSYKSYFFVPLSLIENVH